MTFEWRDGRTLEGIEYKQVALERKRKAYGGVLTCVDGVPYLWGFDVNKIEGPPQLVPLRKGDMLTLLK